MAIAKQGGIEQLPMAELGVVAIEVKLLEDYPSFLPYRLDVSFLSEAGQRKPTKNVGQILGQDRPLPLDQARTGKGVALLNVVLMHLRDLVRPVVTGGADKRGMLEHMREPIGSADL